VIELPADTSHLCQSLDLCIFGFTKKEYPISGRINMELQKLSKTIKKILKAWHCACHQRNVLAAWKSGGFVLILRDGTVVGVAINPTSMAMKSAR
jgi:hypothetical protein